jgi:hypothetical protein
LPTGAGGAVGGEKGAAIEERLRNPLWDTITAAGRHAAHDLNETPPAAAADGEDRPSL